MDANKTETAASTRPRPQEPQAPPYVLHPRPFEPAPAASGETECLPIYTEYHDPNSPISTRELNIALFTENRARENDVNIWRTYINCHGPGKQTEEERAIAETQIITHYFSAIERGQEDVIALLVKSHFVTANTKKSGITPLLMAISRKNVKMVQLLLDLGADPNEFGSPPSWNWRSIKNSTTTLRTPLQLAASMGNLVLVKILMMEQYHCDDSLIAPDGQIALRLAAENGHQEVVDYLPARRGGGFRRWKHKNKTAIRRAKRAAQGIGTFLKFFVWDIEKFLLWSVPKHLVVKPLMKGSVWCWKHRKQFGPWCVHQLREMPRRATNFAKWVGKTIGEIGKWLRKIIVKIPKLVKDFATWIWKLVTIRLPKAVALLAHWAGSGLTSLARVVYNAILKIVSLLSTVVAAIASFFRNLTLKDIWNGLCDALSAVFIAFPKLIGTWIMAIGDGTYEMMNLILGELGVILWYIGYGVLRVVTFVPRKSWVILQSFGIVIAKAWYEVRVWINPKAR